MCDGDCSDVDIQIRDENENLIDIGEDVPIAEDTPAWTGDFKITVRMHESGREPCHYGIGIFGQ